MNNNKKNSKFLKIIFYIVFVIFGINLMLGVVNYAHNKNQTIPTNAMQNGIIINQGLLKDFKLGIRPAHKTCCGAIATYNFLKLNGKDCDFVKILRYYDLYGTTAFAALGINPFAIQHFLIYSGFNACTTVNKSEMHNLAKQSKVSILMYFHSQGAHFITLQYNSETDKFITYNEVYGWVLERSIDEIFTVGKRYDFLPILIYVK